MAITFLANQGWIKSREIPSDKKARQVRNYVLAVPVKEIMTSIENQEKNETNNQLTLIRKMRSFV